MYFGTGKWRLEKQTNSFRIYSKWLAQCSNIKNICINLFCF